MQTKLGEFVRWIRREFSKRSLVGLAFVAYCAIPDYKSRNDFWKSLWPWFKSFVIVHQRIVVLVVGILIIWWDHHRLVKRQRTPVTTQEKPSEPSTTLRQRTLEYVDELRAWLRELGPQPHEEYKSEMTAQEFIKANLKGFIGWFDRYYHGFHLGFAERANQLYHEFGLRSLKDDDLAKALVNQAKDPSDAQTIADSLAGLAAKLEES